MNLSQRAKEGRLLRNILLRLKKVDGGIKSNFILLHVFIFYLTKNYENKLEKTELKGETEGADLATFLTSIPTYAASTAMNYNPFLAPLDLEDKEEEAEQDEDSAQIIKNLFCCTSWFFSAKNGLIGDIGEKKIKSNKFIKCLFRCSVRSFSTKCSALGFLNNSCTQSEFTDFSYDNLEQVMPKRDRLVSPKDLAGLSLDFLRNKFLLFPKCIF